MDQGMNYYQNYLNGDEASLEKLIDLYKDGLILYLYQFTHDIYHAEELTEDTFVKVVVKKPLFIKRCSFKTWLYTIARNIAIDDLRRHSKVKEVPLEKIQHMLIDKQNLEMEYIKEERDVIVHQTMEMLNNDYRQVLYLSYFENFDNETISKMMHKNKRQVENLLYNAKKALKKELEKVGVNHENF